MATTLACHDNTQFTVECIYTTYQQFKLFYSRCGRLLGWRQLFHTRGVNRVPPFNCVIVHCGNFYYFYWKVVIRDFTQKSWHGKAFPITRILWGEFTIENFPAKSLEFIIEINANSQNCQPFLKEIHMRFSNQITNYTWSNQTIYKLWDEITKHFPNFTGCTVEIWEWVSKKFIPHVPGHMIINPCWDLSQIILVKETPSVGGICVSRYITTSLLKNSLSQNYSRKYSFAQ